MPAGDATRGFESMIYGYVLRGPQRGRNENRTFCQNGCQALDVAQTFRSLLPLGVGGMLEIC
jgi:hypothetical protein